MAGLPGVSPFTVGEPSPERRSDLPKDTQPKWQTGDSIRSCWPLEFLLPTSLLWLLSKVLAAVQGRLVRGPLGEVGEGRPGESADRLDINRQSLFGGNRRGKRHLCAWAEEALSKRYVGINTLENNLATSVRLKMVCPFT